MEKEKSLEKIDMKTWFSLFCIIILIGINKINFNPTAFLKIASPIFLSATFVLLGVFAITEVRKTIKENLARKTKNIIAEITRIRARQEYQNLKDQIKSDQDILSLRESLTGFERNYFEKCIIYSSIFFALTLLLTFLDLGSYIQISNIVILTIVFFIGLYYFSRMIQSIFFALNIVKTDD